jgi:hypothetical protein
MHDFTMMYAMHNALRRELEALAGARAVSAGTPGWEIFRKALHAHHAAEDETLWPVMRRALAGRADALALLDAMEAEHALVDPILAALDGAIAAGRPIGGLVAELTGALTRHLDHEERETLALIDDTVTEAQMRAFGEAHAARMGPDAARILPWLLDGVDAQTEAALLGRLPEPARQVLQTAWRPAYAALDLWPGLRQESDLDRA